MKIIAAHPTGSWFTCNPPVLDTDEDWIVLIEGNLSLFASELEANGWGSCDHEGARSQYNREEGWADYWIAMRKGKVNWIITNDEAYYLRSLGATLVCKQLNLKDKDERIKLFRAIKFEEAYGGRYV